VGIITDTNLKTVDMPYSATIVNMRPEDLPSQEPQIFENLCSEPSSSLPPKLSGTMNVMKVMKCSVMLDYLSPRARVT
jgi:hypothetical protein